MDCPRCGHPAAPGDAFCESCGFDLRVPPTDAAPSSPAGPAAIDERRSPRLGRYLIGAAIAIVVIAAIGIALVGFGEDSGGETATPAASPSSAAPTEQVTSSTSTPAGRPGESPGEIFLEAAGSGGPDPFTGEVFTAPVVSTTAPVGTEPEVPPVDVQPGQVAVAGRSGDEPGLYGGSRDNARCDATGILRFLQENPDKAAAWAEAVDADPDLSWGDDRTELEPAQLADYFAQLTPATLLGDTRVTNNGFRDGRPTPRQSVLEAGTAVLIDAVGVPRARCACGNPLRAPEAAPTAPRFVGDAWPEFDERKLVVVVPAGQPMDGLTLVDLETGDEFARPIGSDGSRDGPPVGSLAAAVLVAPEFPVTDGVGIEETYDTASFTIELDPANLSWIAFSGAEQLQDMGAGVVERVPDGVPDLVFPNLDDYLVVEVSKDGVSSGPFVVHDRDAWGTPIGNQAVIYGMHPSVWFVSSIDWSTDPPTSATTTAAETGTMTEFFETHGAGTYQFDVSFVNKWTGMVAHGPIYLLAG